MYQVVEGHRTFNGAVLYFIDSASPEFGKPFVVAKSDHWYILQDINGLRATGRELSWTYPVKPIWDYEIELAKASRKLHMNAIWDNLRVQLEIEDRAGDGRDTISLMYFLALRELRITDTGRRY